MKLDEKTKGKLINEIKTELKTINDIRNANKGVFVVYNRYMSEFIKDEREADDFDGVDVKKAEIDRQIRKHENVIINNFFKLVDDEIDDETKEYVLFNVAQRHKLIDGVKKAINGVEVRNKLSLIDVEAL